MVWLILLKIFYPTKTEVNNMSAVNASSARFLISIADFPSSDFTVTKFTGDDTISGPYCFEIEFQLSESASLSALTADTVLGKPCRFELKSGRDGGITAYNGVVMGFDHMRRAKPVYSIRLVPWIGLLSLNINNRVFQKLDVISIVQKVIESAGLDKCCAFRYECNRSERQYPRLDFCVQYQETDLNFISRLMERNGIWYYFEDGGPSPAKETVVIADAFSKFPAETIDIPFVENIGFAEISTRIIETDGGEILECGGDFGESVYSLSTKSSMIPKSVRLRSQNYRTPENLPDGVCESGGEPGGRWGSVYEYGGTLKNFEEAERLARLYLHRLQVENLLTDGKSGCTAFRAGRLAAVRQAAGKEMGTFLLTSVTHKGGISADGGASYTYNNDFRCIDSADKVYAPPLTAVPPRAAGLITAPVEALGEEHPNISDLGLYRVRMPFDVSETAAYGATKDIRVSQPSGGEGYGMHFPSKRGAEMAVAFIDGNPDKPMGLGFVPNAGAPSTVCCENRDHNILRTWGGNELVMDDTPGKENVTLATTVDDETGKNCELLLDNEKMTAILKAWMHEINMSCNTRDCSISLSSCGQNEIKIDDIMRKITMETMMGCALELNEAQDTVSLTNACDPVLTELKNRSNIAFDTVFDATAGNALDALSKKSPIELRSNAVNEILKELPWKTKTGQKLEERFPRNTVTMDGKNKNIVIETAGGCKIAIYDKIVKGDTEGESGNGKIVITTQNGCTVELDNEKDLITLQNANKSNKVVLDGKGKALSLESTGGVSISAGGNIDIKAAGNISIKADADAGIEAVKNISIGGENVTSVSKEMTIIKSEKKAAVKGKSGLNLTTSSSGGNILTQAKSGETLVKGKKIKMN
jgi:type VI secretion system secreted protein VgrG